MKHKKTMKARISTNTKGAQADGRSNVDNTRQEEVHSLFEKKMDMANRIAARIQTVYGFRHMKCLHMAMQGEWWATTKNAAELDESMTDTYAEQVLADIKNGTID